MTTIRIHKYSGVLSAYGLALAHVVDENQKVYMKSFTKDNYAEIEMNFKCMQTAGHEKLSAQNFCSDEIFFERILHMRYEKTDCMMTVTQEEEKEEENSSNNNNLDAFRSIFLEMYKREFGFVLPERDIIVDDIR